MSSKKKFFLDRRFVLFFLATAFVVTVTVLSFSGSVVLGAIFAFVSLVSVIATALTPFGFVMDDRGIRICYPVFVKQELLWDKIERVTLEYDDAASRGRMHLPYLLDSYALHGESEGRVRFFMSAKIPRTSRARRAIEHYMTARNAEFEILDERKKGEVKL